MFIHWNYRTLKSIESNDEQKPETGVRLPFFESGQVEQVFK